MSIKRTSKPVLAHEKVKDDTLASPFKYGRSGLNMRFEEPQVLIRRAHDFGENI
jgi:hypothetical protein